MTDEQNVFYESFFEKYGSSKEDMERNIRMWLMKPSSIMDTGSIESFDKSAEQYIKTLQNYLTFLQLYRADLVTRYNELLTDPFVEVVRLVRERQSYGKGKVYYYFGIYKRYIDSGKETLISNTRYEGKQRTEALKAFHDYTRLHPDAVQELKIDKAHWE